MVFLETFIKMIVIVTILSLKANAHWARLMRDKAWVRTRFYFFSIKSIKLNPRICMFSTIWSNFYRERK